MAARESDQPIVLRDGRAVHKGKALTGIRSLYRKHGPDTEGRMSSVNHTGGHSVLRR